MDSYNYKKIIWKQFSKNKIGLAALIILGLFFFIGLYAPFLASSKPLLVMWNGQLYSPLLRYLFYPGFYTKPIDLFYNVLMFLLPIGIVGSIFLKGYWRKCFLLTMAASQTIVFIIVWMGVIKDPASDPRLKKARHEALESQSTFREDPLLAPISSPKNWSFELQYMTPYGKLNQLLRYYQRKKQHERLAPYARNFIKNTGQEMPTLWAIDQRNETKQKVYLEQIIEKTKEDYYHALDQLPELIAAYRPYSNAYIMAKYDLEQLKTEEAEHRYLDVLKESDAYRPPLAHAREVVKQHSWAMDELYSLEERKRWLEKESKNLKILIPSLARSFHWEEDAGGAQAMNAYVPWTELTRINRKDLISSLIFGIRVSIVVGFSAAFLSLLVGIPLGTFSGYFAGKTDLVISRFIEIWEAMPTFFMLLLIIAMTQSKSIFLVVAVLGIFGWTGFGRFMRAEVLKQRNLPYVMACKSLAYGHNRIMFSHILPNAIPPILTLLPFSMMAAITSEAGISFLGLGEEGSTSWGVLMDEGRSVFPGESYLIWPPAILLTLLLISIALVGDAMRDAIDPKMRT